jgi:hypothetical protein
VAKIIVERAVKKVFHIVLKKPPSEEIVGQQLYLIV